MKDRIDAKVFYRTLAALVVPIALQNLINAAVQGADVVMLGLVGEEVLSASSLAGQVQFVMLLFFFGLGSGATVLTAQYWGKGDRRAIEKVISIALRLSMLVAFLFFLAASLAPGVLMRIFTNDAVLIGYGVTYLRIVAFSYLFMGFTNLYLLVMRSVERVLVSTVVYFISLLTNVVLNAILIFGLLGFPAMGIAGAAIATTIARFVELVITIVYACKNPVVRLRFADYTSWHGPLGADFRKFALPTTLNEFFWGLGISANSVVIGRLGAAAVAANSVTQVVRQLSTVVSFGLAAAAAVIVGKALGAGEPAKAQAYATRMLRLTLALGLASGVLVLAVRPAVVSVMNLSAEANGYLSLLLLVLAAYVVVQSFDTTLIVGIFRGGGDIRFGLFLDICSMWGGSILWGALAAFVFRWPVQVVLVILLADEFIKAPIALWRYKKRYWLRNVTREGIS